VALLARYQIDDSKIIYDTIDGEVVLVNVETGNYYQLPGAGGEVWRCVALGMDVAQIVRQLAVSYEGDVAEMEASTRRLIEELLSENLVTPAAPAQEGEVPVPAVIPREDAAVRTAYVAPLLNKYTDLQGLLLVDPIHGVDEEGWPTLKTDESGEVTTARETSRGSGRPGDPA
jgi:hypothetical protein